MQFKRKTIQGMLATLACCAAVAMPGQVMAEPGASEAENIRSLNIMLMVTSLRCRTTAHDFRDEYQRFNVAHKNNLNGAGYKLQNEMTARYGSRGSKRALDRINVQIANSYGLGHPWLECDELKQITHELSTHRDRSRLSAAASKLLGRGPAPVLVTKDNQPQTLALASSQ